MPSADWRSESAYDETKKAETVDIAWEWLRRSHEYQQEYSNEQSSATSDQFRRKWGLTFSS
ncbi:transcriptional regulator domain-containing protein [Bradyrhizobium macuxiense]|uniref:transcriptional regulator domain-containing protein n=1 Tax=Bradyrhizobium macuxiense TaxID=1755647 RepID=UPI003D313065